MAAQIPVVRWFDGEPYSDLTIDNSTSAAAEADAAAVHLHRHKQPTASTCGSISKTRRPACDPRQGPAGADLFPVCYIIDGLCAGLVVLHHGLLLVPQVLQDSPSAALLSLGLLEGGRMLLHLHTHHAVNLACATACLCQTFGWGDWGASL